MLPQKKSEISEIIKKITETNFRAIFLIVGLFPVYQVPVVHYKWSKFSSQIKKPILWCYKDHKSSLLKKIPKGDKKWKSHFNFFNQTKIRYCYHDQTNQILGETFGMCVVENFEMISPNVLARVIETIEGGGLIIFLLDTENNLNNLQNISNGIKKKFKNSPYKTVNGRFFEVLLFSLNSCPTFLALDDKLNVLKNNQKNWEEKFSNFFEKEKKKDESKNLLYELIKNIQGMEPLSCLVSKTKTFDQARALLTFAEAVAKRKLISTILLTSARGRGKSAVLGLASAAAVAYGYGNIFITAPAPENLHSFFAFLFIGFKLLNYDENIDYEIIQNSKLKFIEKVRIFSSHRQEITFLFPYEVKERKNQIELLIIEEAAAIPEEDFKNLLGPYNVFISSTNSGYEGSGRALSLKLLNNLKEFHYSASLGDKSQKSKILKEIILEEPIRYSKNDPVENWLNSFLCLDPVSNPVFLSGCPDPKLCRLFLVDRNALFSGHKVSKCFLQKIFGLFASSHYRNSPDDLQLLCDAPSHRILILIPPFNFSIGFLPDVLCALHVSYEGQLSRFFVQKNLLKGKNVSGDLIPWVISKYYLDPSFAELSGVRIIRIVTHPDIQNMGYGTRALNLLQKISNEEVEFNQEAKKKIINDLENVSEQKISPVLVDLEEKKFLKLDYFGVSFGLTFPLFCFWRKNGFFIVFLQENSKKLSTGQVCIMLRPCKEKKSTKISWVENYRREFFRKFLNLLGIEFRSIPVNTVYNIIENIKDNLKGLHFKQDKIRDFLTSFDFNRLFFFVEKNSIGYKVILDILPTLSRVTFWCFSQKTNFSHLENLILISIGLQNKTIKEVTKELSVKNFF